MDEITRELTIVGLNDRGEGLADYGPVAPGALPGERVLAAVEGRRARVIEILDVSPERAEPFCPYYGDCGGCAAQHLQPKLYGEWKRDSLVRALARTRVEAIVGPLVDAHGVGRRRATLHSRIAEDGRERVGFMRARAHDIVTIDACPLFSPDMGGAIEAARALAADVRGAGKPLDI